MRRFLPVLIILLLGGVAFFVGKYYLGGNTKQVKIGFTHETMEALVIIAKKKDYFKDVGLEAELVDYTIGKEAIEKGLLEGQIDIAPSAVTPIVLNYLAGAPIRIITTISRSDDQLKILARKSSGVSVINDLKGKRIGTQKGSAAHFFLSSILEQMGFRTNQYTFIFPENVEDLPVMIADKKIDALSIKEPIITDAKNRIGTDAIMFSPTKVVYKTFNLVATQMFTKKNPETITLLLQALLKAEEFIKNNPSEAKEICASYTGMSRSQVESQWETTSFELLLDEALLENIGSQGAWVMDQKLTEVSSLPSPTDLIYSDGLRSVKMRGVYISN